MQNIKTFIRMYRQLIQILNKRQKITAISVAFLAMVSALLETLGVSVVLPFILAMLQPEELMENFYVAMVLQIFGINDVMQMLVLIAGGIILVYFLKNAFVLFFNYIQLRFRNGLERDLSVLMLKSYLYKPYSFFLDVNRSEIMRGITGDISGVATVVDRYCHLLNEGLTCILIGTFLILINPVMAVSLLLLAAVTALLIVTGLRKRIAACGIESRNAFAQRYQHAYQAINGIKEINVMKRQNNFLRYFSDASDKACKINTKYLWISMLPSRVIEVIFISGLILLVLFNYQMSDDMTVLIAQFGSLAVASIRVLPAMSNIAGAMTSLVYNRPALENAYDNIVEGQLHLLENEESKLATNIEKERLNHIIKIDSITWRYDERLPAVLKDLSFEIMPGEAIGLIGESGAGKTTLADILLGLFKPQEGKITADGKDIFDISTCWHKMVGYVPQNVFLIDDTVRNNILFGIDAAEADEEKIWRVVEQAQMKEFVKRLPQGLDTVLGERGVKISGGQRQRIAIARALYYNPDILVLDEATSALDNETENAVIESINALQGEKTLIIVAHRLSTIEKCDKVFEIKSGKVRPVDKWE